MNGIKTTYYTNDNDEIQKIKIQRFKKQEKVSDYTMKIGSKLVIDQLSNRAKKNRGRKVEVTGFKSSTDQRNPILARVKYLDTNRPGTVEIGDLDIIKDNSQNE